MKTNSVGTNVAIMAGTTVAGAGVGLLKANKTDAVKLAKSKTYVVQTLLNRDSKNADLTVPYEAAKKAGKEALGKFYATEVGKKFQAAYKEIQAEVKEPARKIIGKYVPIAAGIGLAVGGAIALIKSIANKSKAEKTQENA